MAGMLGKIFSKVNASGSEILKAGIKGALSDITKTSGDFSSLEPAELIKGSDTTSTSTSNNSILSPNTSSIDKQNNTKITFTLKNVRIKAEDILEGFNKLADAFTIDLNRLDKKIDKENAFLYKQIKKTSDDLNKVGRSIEKFDKKQRNYDEELQRIKYDLKNNQRPIKKNINGLTGSEKDQDQEDKITTSKPKKDDKDNGFDWTKFLAGTGGLLGSKLLLGTGVTALGATAAGSAYLAYNAAKENDQRSEAEQYSEDVKKYGLKAAEDLKQKRNRSVWQNFRDPAGALSPIDNKTGDVKIDPKTGLPEKIKSFWGDNDTNKLRYDENVEKYGKDKADELNKSPWTRTWERLTGGNKSKEEPTNKEEKIGSYENTTDNYELKKASIKLEAKLSDIELFALRSINAKAQTRITLDAPVIVLDSPSITFTSKPKILGNLDDEQTSSQTKIPSPKMNAQQQQQYNEDVQKFGVDKADQLADVRMNPMMGSIRSLQGQITNNTDNSGNDLAQAAGKAIGTRGAGIPLAGGQKLAFDPKNIPEDIKNQRQQIIKDAAEGKKSLTDSALDKALKMEGLHESRDREDIKAYLKNGGAGLDPARTAWCAAFINSTFAQVGIKGTGSNIANSFQQWGSKVDDPKNIKAGDVLVDHRNKGSSEIGGHVLMATGKSRMQNGRFQLEAVSGNYNDSVATDWFDAKKMMIRRADDSVLPKEMQPKPTDSSVQEKPTEQKGTDGDRFNRREQFNKELENPELKERLFAVTLQEVGNKDPESQRALIETVMNRAQSRGKSLNEILNPKYYAGFVGVPKNTSLLRNSPETRKGLEERLNEVLKGSNDSNYATDNASATVAENAMRTSTFTKKTRSGESLFRKDQTPSVHGEKVVQQDSAWYKRVSAPLEKPNQLAQPNHLANAIDLNPEEQDAIKSQLAKDAGIDNIKPNQKIDLPPVSDDSAQSLSKQAGIDDIPDATPISKPEEKPTIADATIIHPEDLDNAIPKPPDPAPLDTSQPSVKDVAKKDDEIERKPSGSPSITPPVHNPEQMMPGARDHGYGRKHNSDGVGFCSI